MISSKKYVADEVPRYIVDLPASPRMDGMDCTPWYFPSRPIWVRGHSRIQESTFLPEVRRVGMSTLGTLAGEGEGALAKKCTRQLN